MVCPSLPSSANEPSKGVSGLELALTVGAAITAVGIVTAWMRGGSAPRVAEADGRARLTADRIVPVAPAIERAVPQARAWWSSERHALWTVLRPYLEELPETERKAHLERLINTYFMGGTTSIANAETSRIHRISTFSVLAGCAPVSLF